MTHFMQRNLPQDVTYWAPVNSPETNEFGHVDTANGVLLKGRWENRVQQVRKLSGEEVVSMAEVFVSADVDVGGFLKLGDFSGEPREADAREIQDVRTTPDLRNIGVERRAYL